MGLATKQQAMVKLCARRMTEPITEITYVKGTQVITIYRMIKINARFEIRGADTRIEIGTPADSLGTMGPIYV